MDYKEGKFKCCGVLHYTPNRFEVSICPICNKKIIMSNKHLFELYIEMGLYEKQQ